MNEKGTHNLGTVDITLRYHFETGRGGTPVTPVKQQGSRGQSRRHARGPITSGWGGPWGRALGRVRPRDLGVPGPGPRWRLLYKYSAGLTANTVSACAAAARVRCLTSTLFEITLWRAVDVLRGVVGLVASETSTNISTRLDSTRPDSTQHNTIQHVYNHQTIQGKRLQNGDGNKLFA